MDPFSLTEQSFRVLKTGAVEKLASTRGQSVEQLRRDAVTDQSIKQQVEVIARRALRRAQLKRAAGLALAERHGFETLGQLSQLAATCSQDEKVALLSELNELVAAIAAKRQQHSLAMWQKAKVTMPFARAARLLQDIPVAPAKPVAVAPADVPWVAATPIPIAVLVDPQSSGDESGEEYEPQQSMQPAGCWHGGLGTVTVHRPEKILAKHFIEHFSRERLTGQD